jgi:hypothetical protein
MSIRSNSSWKYSGCNSYKLTFKTRGTRSNTRSKLAYEITLIKELKYSTFQ